MIEGGGEHLVKNVLHAEFRLSNVCVTNLDTVFAHSPIDASGRGKEHLGADPYYQISQAGRYRKEKP